MMCCIFGHFLIQKMKWAICPQLISIFKINHKKKVQKDKLIREDYKEDKCKSYTEKVCIESASEKQPIKVCYFM